MPSISRLDSAFWFTGHILMHCSAVLSVFDIYYWLDNTLESLNYIHPHNLWLPPSPPPPPGFVYSRQPLPKVTLRPPSQETVTPDRRAPLRRSRTGENTWCGWRISISAVPFGFVRTAWSTISDGIGPEEEKRNVIFQGWCSLAQVRSQRTSDFPLFFSTGVLQGCNLFLRNTM